jgi:hypothetical protein
LVHWFYDARSRTVVDEFSLGQRL